MVRSLQKHKLNNKGFTLLEILVVVIILGILAALAIPVYNAATENAIRQEALLSLGALRESEQRFFAGNNNYTTTIGGTGIDYDPRVVAGGAVRHFNYSITAAAGTGNAATFSALATRNASAPAVADGAGYSIAINQAGTQTRTDNIAGAVPALGASGT